MSNNLYFFDSNIWIYQLLFNPDQATVEDIEKRDTAIAITDIENAVISTQVINEVCFNLRRKAKADEALLKQVVQDFYDACLVIELNADILLNACDLRNRYNFSFWDGLIVASAIAANAETLYSEDMQAGLVVADRLTIKNPFQ